MFSAVWPCTRACLRRWFWYQQYSRNLPEINHFFPIYCERQPQSHDRPYWGSNSGRNDSLLKLSPGCPRCKIMQFSICNKQPNFTILYIFYFWINGTYMIFSTLYICLPALRFDLFVAIWRRNAVGFFLGHLFLWEFLRMLLLVFRLYWLHFECGSGKKCAEKHVCASYWAKFNWGLSWKWSLLSCFHCNINRTGIDQWFRPVTQFSAGNINVLENLLQKMNNVLIDNFTLNRSFCLWKIWKLISGDIQFSNLFNNWINTKW